MIKIGITGSLSSGKTTVSKMISRKKYPLFSADQSVLNLYRNINFKKKIKKTFNLKNSKNLKKKIKNLIKEDKKKLRKLELIIHPLVRKEMKDVMRKKNVKISIFEIPLLIESKLKKYFDIVIFVAAKKNIRLKRYLKKGGNKKIFTILEKRQYNQNKKIKLCDYVIYNNKSLMVLKNNIKILNKKL